MLDLVALTPITLRLPGDGNALSRKDGTWPANAVKADLGRIWALRELTY